MNGFETIEHEGIVMAMIIRAHHRGKGIEFFTPDEYSQQLAYMCHPEGHHVQPHIHQVVHREVTYTQEVLLIRKGRVRIDFYDGHKNYLKSVILAKDDVILLSQGGHGLVMLEETEMIEVKQGPYVGEVDKERFHACPEEAAITIEA